MRQTNPSPATTQFRIWASINSIDVALGVDGLTSYEDIVAIGNQALQDVAPQVSVTVGEVDMPLSSFLNPEDYEDEWREALGLEPLDDEEDDEEDDEADDGGER